MARRFKKQPSSDSYSFAEQFSTYWVFPQLKTINKVTLMDPLEIIVWKELDKSCAITFFFIELSCFAWSELSFIHKSLSGVTWWSALRLSAGYCLKAKYQRSACKKKKSHSKGIEVQQSCTSLTKKILLEMITVLPGKLYSVWTVFLPFSKMNETAWPPLLTGNWCMLNTQEKLTWRFKLPCLEGKDGVVVRRLNSRDLAPNPIGLQVYPWSGTQSSLGHRFSFTFICSNGL